MTLGLRRGSIQSSNFFHAGLGELDPRVDRANSLRASSADLHVLNAASVNARAFGTAADSQIDTQIDTQNRRASGN